MSNIRDLDKAAGVEDQCQQSFQSSVGEDNEQSSKQYQPGSFGCHELLDRTAFVANIIEDYVLNHPSCMLNKQWYGLAERAVAALHELYQRIGEEHLD
ncbi:MAG: hypothetical protein HQL05_07885 [Nitrospirae bacterium]|uniref:hypothetical protein n=1 Tax=Candidatus Magnetobacterium casense TaxID=1455061 RepID=UPI0005902086|nr:hypothetical protein [Candidatus Magnetobacterium casensis]MBF0337739.1 hypothetical protein [Nitrospirota bacterium]